MDYSRKALQLSNGAFENFSFIRMSAIIALDFRQMAILSKSWGKTKPLIADCPS
jgi:hypothetical protein